jgi:hypothetical protein
MEHTKRRIKNRAGRKGKSVDKQLAGGGFTVAPSGELFFAAWKYS